MGLLTAIKFMARPKKVVVEPIVEVQPEVKVSIESLSIDFHSEGLNNMGRKINEIIDYINTKI